MHVATRQPSKCVLCAFRTSIWAPLFAVGGGSKRLYRTRRDYTPHRKDQKDPSYVSRVVNPISGPATRKLLRTAKPNSRSQQLFCLKKTVHEDDGSYSTFTKLVLEQWSNLRSALAHWPTSAHEVRSWGITSEHGLDNWSGKFSKELKQCCADAVESYSRRKDPPSLIQRLRKAFLGSDINGLVAALKYSFENFVLHKGFSQVNLESQRRLADLRNPIEWYPQARTMQRKIHLHVGPTNSGKTYQALQRLEAAKTGIYGGPLRLLAHEVYTRLNAKNIPCSLITGEERRFPEGHETFLSSCTVEMVPLNINVDVAVIDEIQMMGDPSRGWAWTQTFLGVRAKEVHLCGEMRTIPLIQELCTMTGDSLEIHKYDRLSPLKTMKTSLKGDLQKLEKGDAIILFSRLGIHAMKKEVEKATGRRCAVVYGSLPPETRAQQANLFNDPSNDYDFLVASDAVGMGLNLSIKRIIFESTSKRDENGFRTLQVSEIKQIAGRAGRYRTASQGVEESLPSLQEDVFSKYPLEVDIPYKKGQNTIGLVTTLQDVDMPILQRAMSSEAPPLATAGIIPSDEVIARYAAYFPEKTPFSHVLLGLQDISAINPRFHLCNLREHLQIADAIQEYDLTINDRIVFMGAPTNFRRKGIEFVLKALARCVADLSGGDLLDIKEINIELLDEDVDVENKEYLRRLEDLHGALTLYLWLSYRFTGVFRSRALAFHVKSLVEEKIDSCLAKVGVNPSWRMRSLTYMRQHRAALSSVEPASNFDPVLSSTPPAPSFGLAEERQSGEIHPFSKLQDATEEKNPSISLLNYVDLGPLDLTHPKTWQATVSVTHEGQVVQETSTGSSKAKAKWNAAQAVIQKLPLGKTKPTEDSLPKHDVLEEAHLVMPSVWAGTAQTSLLVEGAPEGEGQRMFTVG